MKKNYKNKGEQGFTTFDIIKGLVIKRERLREWMNHGFISPSSPAKGVGTKAIFSILDVYKIAVFKTLIEAGINRRIASTWVNTNPRLNNEEDVKKIRYIIIFEGTGSRRLFCYLEPGPWDFQQDLMENSNWRVGIMVNFEKLRREIKEAFRSA